MDAHVHPAAGASWYFPLFVAHGVTSVRNMHTTVDTALELTRAVRRRVSSGKLIGPRFLASGPIIDGPPPAWPGSVVAATPEEGQAAVDSLASGVADFVKVYDNLRPETYRAIADAARRRGIPFDGHVPFLVPATQAAAAGQRTVEHTTSIKLACSSSADSLREEFTGLPERMPSMGFPERPVAFFTLVCTAGDSRDPAETFGMADTLGTVAEARLADLVLLEENPLEDIRATTSIAGVVLDGQFLDRAALDALVAEAAGE